MNEGFFNALLSIATALIGMFGVAMGLEGFLKGELHWALRVLAAAGGLCLIYPGWLTDVIGLVVVGGIVLLRFLKNGRPPVRAA